MPSSTIFKNVEVLFINILLTDSIIEDIKSLKLLLSSMLFKFILLSNSTLLIKTYNPFFKLIYNRLVIILLVKELSISYLPFNPNKVIISLF